MRYYRLYFMDAFSGHIEHFREFEASDDEAAFSVAEGWGEDGPMELWSRDRKLKRWDPSSTDRLNASKRPVQR
jgi:hypothetical protein